MQLSRALRGRWHTVREWPVLHPTAFLERWREQRGGHPVDPDHRPHAAAALEWLLRAQESSPDDGIARGYNLIWEREFGLRGWQPSYPETTGYIIPTLYATAAETGNSDLRARAERAARWEITIQQPTGATLGGVLGQDSSPAVFNTGQVLFGWLAAFEETGDGVFADAARRAGRFLVSVQEPDGIWRKANSRFARPDTTLYNARVAWALAEAGTRLDAPEMREAAARNLCAVAARQWPNGWFPDCCLTDPQRPLLHTLAYTIRGLIEGGRVLEDDQFVTAGIRAADALLGAVRADGWIAGRFESGWDPAVTWSCLTGNAQMAGIWMRLYAMTGDGKWLEPVPRVLAFLKSTQNRSSSDPGLRGGIKGAAPVSGGYGRYEVLSWATKFFLDALRRHAAILDGRVGAGAQPIRGDCYDDTLA